MEGVLMQDTNFDVELIIANDCSTDNSDRIIKDLLQNTDSKISIQYYYHIKNKGIQPNFIFAFEKCQGNYIALCEGDDYWTDPLKLQKQVDFLEAHPEYSYCSHQSMIKNLNVLESRPMLPGVKTLNNIINGNILNTATLLIRKNAIDEPFPEFFKTAIAGDWLLQFMALKNGNAYVLEDTMSVYRKHETSVWSSLNTKEMGQLGIDTLIQAKKLFNNDKETLFLIDNAIKARAKKFGIKQETLWSKIKKRILF